MSMAENIKEEIVEDNVSNEDETTSVEIDLQSEDSDDSSESRTIVQEETEKVKAESKDDELANYSEGVKKRINKLTAKQKLASEEADAAVNYARQKEEENEALRQKLARLDKGYLSEYEGRVSSQENDAKRALAEALDAGDNPKVADAQSAISAIAVEKERLRVQKARSAREAEQMEAQRQQAQAQAQNPQPRVDPARDAENVRLLGNWREENDWYGNDKVMTAVATQIHSDIVNEGIDPISKSYYQEIDKRMRAEMPHKFKSEKPNVQVVTPTSGNGRPTKKGRKQSVELTKGQVAFANKMRIPLDKYAAEVVRLENRRD